MKLFGWMALNHFYNEVINTMYRDDFYYSLVEKKIKKRAKGESDMRMLYLEYYRS